MDDEDPMGALSGVEDFSQGGILRQLAEYERDAMRVAQNQQQMRQQQLEDGRQRLEQMQFGPSRAEQLFALSAAFARPQRMKGFAGMMDNLMPTLGGLAGARQTADARKADALLRLQEQYASGKMDGEQSSLAARLEALKARAQLAKPQKRRTGFNPVTGQLADMDTGEPIVPGVVSPTSRSEYDALPSGARYMAPDGKIRTKGGGPTQPASGNFPTGNPLEPPRR